MTISDDPSLGPPAALTLLRRAEHVLFVGLLAFGLVRSVTNSEHAHWAIPVSAVVAGWYGVGIVAERQRSDESVPGEGRTAAGWWLAGLSAGWVALVVISPVFVWLVFAVFLLHLQLFPLRLAIAAVAGLAGVAIAAVALHQGRVTAAGVIGPIIGAAVAVVITAVYRGLRDEAARRALLLVELTTAQSRLAVAERQAGSLAERERLARDIHDTIAQSLTSILLLLRSVHGQAERLPHAASQQLDAAVAAAQDALDDTRRVVRALAPAHLAGHSLTDALASLIADRQPVGVDLALDVEGDPYQLPTATAVALLRTAQGALGNVIAHAKARHARLTLTYQPSQVSLDIADDGRGFDPAATPQQTAAGTGIGLDAMRTRLAEIGGILSVESTPGTGTAVSATIPVEAAEANDD